MKNTFTFIDLFAGIGGFKMALSNNGGRCIKYSEINKDAIDSYCKNYDESPSNNLGDITKIKQLPTHDVLTAGVPCQSWSIAGKNLGFDDDRGQLWNDTIYLLKKSQPKAFIFENVKGLADPRNKESFLYILNRIKEAGYYAKHFIINSYDYGVPQNRKRVFIVGFRNKTYSDKFQLPKPFKSKIKLSDILDVKLPDVETGTQKDLFGNVNMSRQMSLSSKNGFNDYFLFNDLRNGQSTIHSWDIIETSDRQKEICLLLLKNRRKSQYGILDGNPLSLEQFKTLDDSITQKELSSLVELGILKEEEYRFEINDFTEQELTSDESELLSREHNACLIIVDLKTFRPFKVKKIPIKDTLESLKGKGIIKCSEIRYDFKNSKISSGLFGVNRVFLPTSDVFPTLVASDTNDYVTLTHLNKENHEKYKKDFLEKIYFSENYRKITKEEACAIQGFPKDFKLPESRVRWMKLVGNSVSVSVIDMLAKAIINTGIFEENEVSENQKVKSKTKLVFTRNTGVSVAELS
ncbi:DNA (cytosine-5-)-methyltransferase [Nonlabens spongiae]|nr:DNA (cytosine-5-)-methyltransferase [Nonlabens spongiae]